MRITVRLSYPTKVHAKRACFAQGPRFVGEVMYACVNKSTSGKPALNSIYFVVLVWINFFPAIDWFMLV